MELREYMSIRRAYNLVRKDVSSQQRLTFEEYAILAHLYREIGRASCRERVSSPV